MLTILVLHILGVKNFYLNVAADIEKVGSLFQKKNLAEEMAELIFLIS